jgi:hypothetical protein
MINRVKEFQNFGRISSIPQGLIDPDEMGKLAAPSYDQYLDKVIEELSAAAEECKAKLGLWPKDAHGSRMYKEYQARAIGARIVIEELFELKCTMRDARKK